MSTKAILIVLVASNSCDLRNIDVAQPTSFTHESLETCRQEAAIIDEANNIRAFCIEYP